MKLKEKDHQVYTALGLWQQTHTTLVQEKAGLGDWWMDANLGSLHHIAFCKIKLSEQCYNIIQNLLGLCFKIEKKKICLLLSVCFFTQVVWAALLLFSEALDINSPLWALYKNAQFPHVWFMFNSFECIEHFLLEMLRPFLGQIVYDG